MTASPVGRRALAGSDRFFNDGVLVESLTVNGVTVQVSLQDTGWNFWPTLPWPTAASRASS